MVDKTIVVRLNAITGQYQAQMGAAAASTAGFSRSVAASTTSAGSKIAQFGKVAATVGKVTLLGVAAGLALSAKAAIEFESSFAGVEKTVTASAPQFERLKTAIREMSTEIPIGVNELNRIAELGGQLGVEVGGLPEFVETIGKIGVTTNLAVDDAALAFARLDNILGLGGKNFEELGSTLVDLGNNFAATESEITTFALRIAPIGATVGLSADEVLALAAAFTSVGVPAERGGTAVQKTFIKIADAVANGSDALNGFATTAGLSADAFAELFKEDPAEAFKKFVEGLDKVNKSGGNVFALFEGLELNNQRVIASLLAMANASDVLDDALNDSEDAWEANIALTEEAEKRFETTASKIALAKNQMNDLAIEIGNNVIPIIGNLADGVGDFLAGLETLDGPLKFVLLGISGVTAAVLISQIAFKGLTRVIGVDLVKSFGLAGTAAGIFRIAVGGVLIGALLLLIDHMVAVGQAQRDAEERVKSLTEAFREQRKGAADSVAETIALNAITEEIGGALLRLGIRTQTFAQALAGNKDAIAIVTDRLKFLREERDKLAGGLDPDLKLQEDILTMTAAERRARGLGNVIEDLAIIEELLGRTLTEVNLAKHAEELEHQLELEAELIESGGDLGDRMVLQKIRSRQAAAAARELNTAYVLQEEELEKVGDLLDDYSEAVVESMEESRAATLDNVVSWEHWAGDVELNLTKVIEGLTQRLKAERDFFFQIEHGLASEASPAVIDFLNLLDSESKFAFLNLGEQDKAAFIAQLETFFGTAEAFLIEKIGVELPKILELEGQTLVGALGGLVEDIVADPETNINAVDAWEGVLEAALLEAGPGLRGTLLDTFGTSFTVDFVGQMFGIGSDAAQGLIDGILLKYGAALNAGAGLTARVEQGSRNEVRAESPSKTMMVLGADMAAGLTFGLEKGLRDFSGIQLSSIGATRHQMGSQVNSGNTTSETANEFNLNIHGSKDTAADGQAALLAARLAGKL